MMIKQGGAMSRLAKKHTCRSTTQSVIDSLERWSGKRYPQSEGLFRASLEMCYRLARTDAEIERIDRYLKESK